MWRTIWMYAALALAFLLLLRLSRMAYISGSAPFEWILAGVAGVFLFLGMVLFRLGKQKTIQPDVDHQKLRQLGLSQREYEVLCAVCKGFSNREIAESLYITESTVKTHVSNLLVKLDARRRTELMHKARALNLTPDRV